MHATPKSHRSLVATLAVALFPLLLAPGLARAADWPQWAGPDRNFQAPAPERPLATDWPEAGPEKLWQRELGLGYSSMAVVGDRLYTQYRIGDDEFVLAVDTATGETAWQYAYAAPHLDDMRTGYGEGPHATPLVHDGRVFAVGVTGLFFALDATDGSVLWQVDLWGSEEGDLAGTFLVRGYASSPILFTGDEGAESIILPVGGESQGFVAFDPENGKIRWRSPAFDNSQSSPILVQVGGEPLLIGFVNDWIVAVDPRSGQERWRREHESGAAYNISTPIFRDGVLTVSSAYGGGTRSLRITPEGAEELWHTNRLKVHYTNMLRDGSHVYGASGNAGSILLTGLELETGDLAWKSREVGRAQLVSLDDQGLSLALTEDAELVLLRLTGLGPAVIARAEIADAQTWSLPVVVGDRVYVRNEQHLMAFRLPLEAATEAASAR